MGSSASIVSVLTVVVAILTKRPVSLECPRSRTGCNCLPLLFASRTCLDEAQWVRMASGVSSTALQRAQLIVSLLAHCLVYPDPLPHFKYVDIEHVSFAFVVVMPLGRCILSSDLVVGLTLRP